MKKLKKLMPILLVFAMLLTFSGCESDDGTSESRKENEKLSNVVNVKKDNDENSNNNKEEDSNENKNTSNEKNPIATMKVEYVNADGNQKEGTIKLELYPEHAPDTVANFVNLANNGFYNGLTFHRIVENFMIQGGDPAGNGTGGAKVSDLDKSVKKDSDEDFEYSIKGEFAANKFDNKMKYEAGTLAMARSDYSYYGFAEEGYNSACSQFFIMNTDNNKVNQSLQGSYAAFGKVIEGYDVVTEISGTKVQVSSSGEMSNPVNAPKIKTIEVETFGVQYKIPNVINSEDVMQKIMESMQR